MRLGKSVEELTDAELEAEIARRRAARRSVVGAASEGTSVDAPRAASALEHDRETLQAYANLELPRGASWPEVEARYRELLARFHPDKHRSDPDRYRIALDVAAGLTRAYQVLYGRIRR